MTGTWVALPGEPLSVPTARSLVRAECAEVGADPETCDSAALLTSELVTNGVLHARTPLDLRITQDGTVLRIEVRDRNPTLPRARRYSTEAATGRGMRLLDTMASSWGVARTGEHGKTVWFEMPLHVPSDDDDDAALAAAFADVVNVDWMSDVEPL